MAAFAKNSNLLDESAIGLCNASNLNDLPCKIEVCECED